MGGQSDPVAALLESPVRRALIDTLTEAERSEQGAGRTAAELASHVGLHLTTVRFHLDQLVAAGAVSSEFRSHRGAGRPRKVYTVVAGATSGRPEVESLRLLSSLLVEALAGTLHGERLTPAEAGRRWALEHVPVAADDRPAESPGRWLGKLAQVVDVLHEWGYTPELATSRGGRSADITLSHCPFHELARANEAVVCGIHRGLIAGSLERLGETNARVTLEPFVGPDSCVAHITTTTAFRAPATKETA